MMPVPSEILKLVAKLATNKLVVLLEVQLAAPSGGSLELMSQQVSSAVLHWHLELQ